MNGNITDRGFSLVELLVALVIVGVSMACIYSVYYSQQKSCLAQEQIVGMQQNLREAMFHMQREIRMAGCDPLLKSGAGIQNLGANSINFTMDITGTGGSPDGDTNDANEDITYLLYDPDGDGVNDLGRNTGGGNQLVAENIDALDFVYLDADGNVTGSIDQVRSVEVSLVARTGRTDPGFINNTVYQNQQGTIILGAQNDGFRRSLLTMNVTCRNLGL